MFPGGVLLAGRKEGAVIACAAGKTSLFAGGERVTRDTIFDLASLTKPFATALAVMYLTETGKIDLQEPVYKAWGGDCPGGKRNIRWLHLLCHNSGLPGYRPYYRQLLGLPPSRRKTALYQWIMDEPVMGEPGTQTVYSDIGYLLLQLGIEAVTGQSFARFITYTLYDTLSVSGLFFPAFGDPGAERSRYAATEICPFRGLLQGGVHDENAYALGGAAGHAGLFGTAGAVYALLQKLMAAYAGEPAEHRLNHGIAARLLRVPENVQRTPGFDVPSPVGASCGRYFTPGHTVGHLGFTGTSCWMDLKRQIIVVLLTNRVHPTRNNEKIKEFRPYMHDAVMRRLL